MRHALIFLSAPGNLAEPKQYPFSITDAGDGGACQADVNFHFTGFALSGRVNSKCVGSAAAELQARNFGPLPLLGLV